MTGSNNSTDRPPLDWGQLSTIEFTCDIRDGSHYGPLATAGRFVYSPSRARIRFGPPQPPSGASGPQGHTAAPVEIGDLRRPTPRLPSRAKVGRAVIDGGGRYRVLARRVTLRRPAPSPGRAVLASTRLPTAPHDVTRVPGPGGVEGGMAQVPSRRCDELVRGSHAGPRRSVREALSCERSRDSRKGWRMGSRISTGAGGVVGGGRGFAPGGRCGCRTPRWAARACDFIGAGHDPIDAARMAGVGEGRTDRSVARRIQRHWRRCDRFRQLLAEHAPWYGIEDEAEADPPKQQLSTVSGIENSRYRHLFRE